LASYPEFGCNPPDTYHVSGTWNEHNDVYIPTDETFTFLDDVLTEVMDIFPSKYIHIGGDEVAKDDWQHSDFTQKLMKKLGLKDEREMQSYFIKRIESFVNSKGRSIIGWDEILEGGIAPNATIMSWRGEQGGIAAAQQNHDVIMTPGSGGLYFDHKQSKNDNEPLNIGGFAPLEKTYSYDPIPESLTQEQQKHIIGVQGNVWTEYMATEAKVGYMVLPRMLALAEIAWSPKEHKNFTDFQENRLPWHLAIIDEGYMDYRVPEVLGLKDTVLTNGPYFEFVLKSPVKGAKIYYTIDGYSPRETDLVYTHPIRLIVPRGKQLILQAIVITPTGKISFVTKTVCQNFPEGTK
jgi:hexosaminidase